MGSRLGGVLSGFLMVAGACAAQPPALPEPAEPAERAAVLTLRIEEFNAVGRYRECIGLAESLVAARLEALGPDHKGTADSFNVLGFFLRLAGRPGEAAVRLYCRGHVQ